MLLSEKIPEWDLFRLSELLYIPYKHPSSLIKILEQTLIEKDSTIGIAPEAKQWLAIGIEYVLSYQNSKDLSKL